MKAERYLLEYMKNANVTTEEMKNSIGIDMQVFEDGKKELMADEFIEVCIYLGVSPDEVLNSISL